MLVMGMSEGGRGRRTREEGERKEGKGRREGRRGGRERGGKRGRRKGGATDLPEGVFSL